jgi:hypothetical protein
MIVDKFHISGEFLFACLHALLISYRTYTQANEFYEPPKNKPFPLKPHSHTHTNEIILPI